MVITMVQFTKDGKMAWGITYCNYKKNRKPRCTHCGHMNAYKSVLEYNFDFEDHVALTKKKPRDT